jgi:RNA polymerase sigma-70 factor (ECF subfamily)
VNDIPYTWRDLFERYGPTLVLYARQWAGTFSDAEDVVQEAFVKMIRKRARPHDPVAYLFGAVRHIARDQQRSAARRRSRERSAMEHRPLFETLSTESEEREQIETTLLTLPESQREVVILKIWGELTFEAIGQVLQVSPNTAASRYRYAIQALRKILDGESGREALT